MKQALIGYTGFVGSNLASQASFTDLFNSKNFREMAGRHFDRIVCAGTSAVKWLANKEPEADRAGIQALEEVLKTVTAEQFVLISTVDVYPVVRGVDETYQCAGVKNHAYGSNRLEFEQFCERTFDGCVTIRLPGLFGAGLKKNVIYDLLNENCLDVINPSSSFQYLDLSRLWALITDVLSRNISLVNLVTEPIATKEIIERFFPSAVVGSRSGAEVHYDVHTCYGKQLGGVDGYILSKGEVMADLERFIDSCLQVRTSRLAWGA